MKPIHKIIKDFQAEIEAAVTAKEIEIISKFGNPEEPKSLELAKDAGAMVGFDLLRYLEAKALLSAAEKIADDLKEAALSEAQSMFPDGKGMAFGVPISLQSTPTTYDWAQDPIWMDLNAASTLRINKLKDEIKAGKMPIPIKSLGTQFIKAVLPK